MGTVVKMQGRQVGKLTEILIEALEAEQQHDRPIVLMASDKKQKHQILRQLMCMTGSKGTRIQVKTYEELAAEGRAASVGTSDSSL